METRFYVYLPDKNTTVGPLAWDQLDEYDDETLVMTADRQEYWPLRRWQADGTLLPTRHDHFKAWFWLLLVAPGIVYAFAPEFWRMEYGVGWFIAFVFAWVGMGTNEREFPRFPQGGE